MENKLKIEEKILEVVSLVDAQNRKYPCRENSVVITKLHEALQWLNHSDLVVAKVAAFAEKQNEVAVAPVPELLTEQQPENPQP